jgi:hypothetical protein
MDTAYAVDLKQKLRQRVAGLRQSGHFFSQLLVDTLSGYECLESLSSFGQNGKS